MSAALHPVFDEILARFHPADPREHSAPPDDGPVPTTEQDERIAFERMLPKINARDVLDECFEPEYQHAIDVAMTRGDARLVGQLLLAVRADYARRLALRELYVDPPSGPTPKQVCASVFRKATSAADRRKA